MAAFRWHLWDLTSLVVHSAALGIELPAAALQYASDAIDATLADFGSAPDAVQRSFRVLDPATPDGVYPYQPILTPPPPPTPPSPAAGPCLECQSGMADGRGLKIEDLGVPLGACASAWRARSHGPADEFLLDCEMVRAWRPKNARTLHLAADL